MVWYGSSSPRLALNWPQSCSWIPSCFCNRTCEAIVSVHSPPKWSPFLPPKAELEDSCAVAINPWHVGKVFITPKGKGQKWHAEYGCSGAVTPVTRGGIEVRRRGPCFKCVPTQVV